MAFYITEMYAELKFYMVYNLETEKNLHSKKAKTNYSRQLLTWSALMYTQAQTGPERKGLESRWQQL